MLRAGICVVIYCVISLRTSQWCSSYWSKTDRQTIAVLHAVPVRQLLAKGFS